MSRAGLYFVAVLLPEHLADQVRILQQYAAEHFDSKRALRSPPHITLVPPFFAEISKVDLLRESLKTFAGTTDRFEVALDGIGAFSDRVIFVDVKTSPDLDEVARRCGHFLRSHHFAVKKEQRPFHPHVTVAFKDLDPDIFTEAFAHFRTIECSSMFETEAITLLIHEAGQWKVDTTFLLSSARL